MSTTSTSDSSAFDSSALDSTPTRNDIKAELNVLQTLADELKDYIIDNDVYRTVLVEEGRGNRTVNMSGGDLLARIHSFKALHSSMLPDEKDQLNGIITQVESTKQSLKSRFHELLARELKSRLGTLSWGLEDRLDNEELTPQPAEKLNLARIQIIRQELGENETPTALKDEMDVLEEQLQDAIAQLDPHDLFLIETDE